MKITIAQAKAFHDLIVETERMHQHHHPECKDKGPNTCPTWEAIHGARNALESIRNQTHTEALPDEDQLLLLMEQAPATSFDKALAIAWTKAADGYRKKLRQNFNDLLKTYRSSPHN